MKLRFMVLLVILLIVADQTVKVVIDTFYFDSNFDILPYVLEFKPVFNDKHSYANALLNQRFGINIGLWVHIAVFMIIQGIVLAVYSHVKKKLKNTKLLDVAICFQIAATVCALISNLFWDKGVLDFLYFKLFVVCDLKDLYLWCFGILFCLSSIVDYQKKKADLKAT